MYTQLFKRVIARAGIVALLFAQFAVAAYACTGIGGAAGVAAAMAAEESMQATMPGCEMNKGNRNLTLCLQHCQTGDQSVQTSPHIPVPAFAAITSFVVVAPVVAATVGELQLKTAWAVLVPLPPPLDRFGILRI